jgi:hypothetical protein
MALVMHVIRHKPVRWTARRCHIRTSGGYGRFGPLRFDLETPLYKRAAINPLRSTTPLAKPPGGRRSAAGTILFSS